MSKVSLVRSIRVRADLPDDTGAYVQGSLLNAMCNGLESAVALAALFRGLATDLEDIVSKEKARSGEK